MKKQGKSEIPLLIKNKHTEELVDHYWGSINYVYELIKSSEIKAGLVLTFYSILLNFSYQKIQYVLVTFPGNTLLYILLGLWFCCTVISIHFSIRCFIPRIEAKFDKNIFFFGDITTKFGTIHEFSKTFYKISVDEDQVFDHLGQQIFIISKIATLKFKSVSRSLRFLAYGMLLLLVVLIYSLILTVK